MPTLLTIAKMELHGIGFSSEQCEKLRSVLQDKMKELEAKCHVLAGRRFSINSPEDIAQVLFLELKLPANGDVESVVVSKRGVRSCKSKARHLSTAKGKHNLEC